jgi:hypothetical protein
MQGRAESYKAKNQIMVGLLKSWARVPEQRLGQFIDNAVLRAGVGDTFSIEDKALADACKAYADSVTGGRNG